MLRTRATHRLALLCLLLSAAAGCRDRAPAPAPPSPAAAATPQRGGTAVAAVGLDFEQVNELIDNGNDLTLDLTYRMFLKLLEEQPDYAEHPPTFAPQLARSYSWSPDHRVLTFVLRDDVTWSDGVPVTSEDVRWTWEAQRDPDVAWSYASAKDHVTDVEVVDPHTVRFHFDTVYSAQLIDANEGVVLPKHAWSALPFSEWRKQAAWFRQHLVVDGPFTLGEHRPQQQLELVRNPRYFKADRPRLDRAVFRVLPDRANQIAQLVSGDVDFVEQIPPAEAARLAKNPELRLETYWPRQYDYVCWNTRNPLFADAMVRRALTMAIDRQALIDGVWRGYARPSVSPILSSVWAADRSLRPWPYDPEAAKRILAERGWSDSDGDGVLDRGGKPFRFELLSNAGNTMRMDAMVAIQAQLARIGVAAEPRQIEGATLTDLLLKHQFDATLSGWAIDTSLDVRYAFHSASIDDEYNFGAYSNPEVDRTIDAIRAVPEIADAKPLLVKLQRLLHDDQPYTFLVEPQRISASRTRLHEARPNALFPYFSLEDWWVDAR